MKLGSRIVELRKKANMTQENLAEQINVSRQAVSKWETDAAIPDGDNLVQLAKVFGITVDELLNTEVEGSAIIKEKKLKKNSSAKIAIIAVSVIAILLVGTLTILHLIKKNEKSAEVIPEVIVEDHYQVSAGRQFSLYLDNEGNVSGMGENDYKQLNLEGWENIIEISAGGFHSLGLKEDGTVVATGYNNWGQIKVEDWSDIIQVSAGRYHSVGLKSDGTVVCVGGEKGSGVCDVKNWNGIIQVSAGRYGTVGLTEDGTLVYAGKNVEGLANFASWKNIVQVAAGTYHTVALLDDGTVLCTGRNGNKSCEVKDWTNIVKIAAGGYHTVGLKEDGTVVATGDNSYGQLNVASWENIIDISGGRYHTIAVTKEGEFLAIGDNRFGQLNGKESIKAGKESNQNSEDKNTDANTITLNVKATHLKWNVEQITNGEKKGYRITWEYEGDYLYFRVNDNSNCNINSESYLSKETTSNSIEYFFDNFTAGNAMQNVGNSFNKAVCIYVITEEKDGVLYGYFDGHSFEAEVINLYTPTLKKDNVTYDVSTDILVVPKGKNIYKYSIIIDLGEDGKIVLPDSLDNKIKLKETLTELGYDSDKYDTVLVALKYVGDGKYTISSDFSNSIEIKIK